MDNLDVILYPVMIAFLTIAVAMSYIHMQLSRAVRRTAELQAAKDALRAHLAAFEKLINEPALPTYALEFLTNFSEAISQQSRCEDLIATLTSDADFDGSSSPVMDEMEKLYKTRADIVELFNRAIFSGVAVAFLRWPGNSSKMAKMIAIMSGGPRKEVQLAYKFTQSRKNSDYRIPTNQVAV